MDAKTKNKLRKKLRHLKLKLKEREYMPSNPKAAYAAWIERKELRDAIKKLEDRLKGLN